MAVVKGRELIISTFRVKGVSHTSTCLISCVNELAKNRAIFLYEVVHQLYEYELA